MSDEQVTLLLPMLMAEEFKHLTSTTVPELTGNCVAVSIVLTHSSLNPLQAAVNLGLFFD